MAESNPYAAPAAPLADPVAPSDDLAFLPRGRAVPAGNGWRWIVSAWRLFLQSPGIWILLTLILVGIGFLIGLIPLLGQLAGLLLTPVLAAGYLAGAAALARGEALEIAHAFAGFREKTGPLIIVGLLWLVGIVVIFSGTMVVFGFGLGLGVLTGDIPTAALAVLPLALLVMLALWVPLFMALWFAPALVWFHGLAPIEAMKASFIGCLKNVMPFLLYGIAAFVLGVLAALPVLLGLIVWIPVLALTAFTSYRDIYLQPAAERS